MAKIDKEFPLGSLHNRQGWEGQLARVARWFDRLVKAKSPIDAEDFLYSFFQNAHHLRDWEAAGKKTREIDEFLNSNLATRICRDVANLTKHHELTKPPSQEYEPSLLRAYAGTGLGWYDDDSCIVVATNYEDKGIVLDAREVARECLRLWCEFLSPNDICDTILCQFEFSSSRFGQVIEEAQSRQEILLHIAKQLDKSDSRENRPTLDDNA